MNNLNSILIEGYLVNNPKRVDFPQNQSILCNLRIANNRFYKKDGEQTQETSYFNVDVWGNTAKNCLKYLKKGNGIRVVGRIKQERWKDAEEKAHQIIKIIAEHVDFFPTHEKKSSGKKVASSNTPTSKTHQDIENTSKEIINL